MNIRYLLILFGFVTAFLSSSSNAQPTETEAKQLLQNIDNAISSIKTVVYKINYSRKFLSKRDTIHTTAVCSLYIAPKDKMKAYNIVDLQDTELNTSTYGHRRYDGKKTFWTNYLIDSLDIAIKPYIDNNKRMRQSIVEGYSHMLLREYLMQKKPLARYVPVADRLKITEEIHKGVPVYIIAVGFKDRDGTSDNVEKHYIRKSDFLPVAFSSFLIWESMEQYDYYEVDYLAINPNISIEDFKIDKNETINAEERYKILKDKAKI